MGKSFRLNTNFPDTHVQNFSIPQWLQVQFFALWMSKTLQFSTTIHVYTSLKSIYEPSLLIHFFWPLGILCVPEAFIDKWKPWQWRKESQPKKTSIKNVIKAFFQELKWKFSTLKFCSLRKFPLSLLLMSIGIYIPSDSSKGKGMMNFSPFLM